jgi:L-alanine-DL-glutamate epimerase-like enolase superfamily enzyme
VTGEERAAASAAATPRRAAGAPWREPVLTSLAPGVTLLRLAAGEAAGQAVGAVAEEDVRAAWTALRHRHALALALALPEDDAPIDAATGLIGLAALDLAARGLGLPAALLLGAAVPPSPPAPLAPLPAPLPAGWRHLPPRGAAALREALLDPATLLILADPVEAGGPAGLRRLSAAARAFQVEVALAPAVAHPLALAAAAHLRAGLGWPASRPVFVPGGPTASYQWPPPHDPSAPGFGWSATP